MLHSCRLELATATDADTFVVCPQRDTDIAGSPFACERWTVSNLCRCLRSLRAWTQRCSNSGSNSGSNSSSRGPRRHFNTAAAATASMACVWDAGTKAETKARQRGDRTASMATCRIASARLEASVVDGVGALARSRALRTFACWRERNTMTRAAAAPILTRLGPVRSGARRPEPAFPSPSAACGEAATAMRVACICERTLQSSTLASNGSVVTEAEARVFASYVSINTSGLRPRV